MPRVTSDIPHADRNAYLPKEMRASIQVLVIVLLSSCSSVQKKVGSHTKLEAAAIDQVYMKKELYGTDSVELSKDQIEWFVNEWNRALTKGPYKVIPHYWITVRFKNDSTRNFRIHKNLIKEHGDWAFSISDSIMIDSFWEPIRPFPKPEDYTPLTFLRFASQIIPIDSGTAQIDITMIDSFPVDWVKEEHLDELFQVLDSQEECGCFLNPLSSHIPTGKAEKGGYVGIFIKSFKEGERINLGAYSCPKVDEELNRALKEWWQNYKRE